MMRKHPTVAAVHALMAGWAGLQRVEAEWQARHEWGGLHVHAMLLDLSGAAQQRCQERGLGSKFRACKFCWASAFGTVDL